MSLTFCGALLVSLRSIRIPTLVYHLGTFSLVFSLVQESDMFSEISAELAPESVVVFVYELRTRCQTVTSLILLRILVPFPLLV